jgi:basic amino acid/polyamine antiporter, APA family
LPNNQENSKQPATLFTRNSTGLVKSISAFDVLSFTLLAAGPMVLIPLGILELPSLYEGVNLPLAFGISIILLLALSYNTVALASTFPRAGGDYVFGSRVIHPIWGMIPSFMVLFSFVIGIGTLVPLALQAFFGPTFLTSYGTNSQVFGAILTYIYGAHVYLFAISAIILILIFALAIASTKAWFWFVRFVSVYALVAIIVFLGYLVVTKQSTIFSNFNSQLSTGFNSSAVVSNATATTFWSPSASASALSTSGAMIFIFFFLAAPISAYFASEIRNTSRSMSIGMLGGTVVSWIIATVGILVWIGAFGYTFMSAFGFEALINPATAPSGAFSANALILAVVGDPNVAFFIGLGLSLAVLGLVAAPMLPASRILFAWSFDRLIPERFARVSERTRTPAFSLGVVALLTVIVAGLDAYFSSVIGAFFATTVIVAIAFLPNGITAALLPFRKKEYFENAPSVAKKRVGGVPLVTITGLIHAIGFAVLIILVFLYPAASGTSTGKLFGAPLEIVLVGLIISIIFYPIARAIRKSASHIDIAMVYREIPPE